MIGTHNATGNDESQSKEERFPFFFVSPRTVTDQHELINIFCFITSTRLHHRRPRLHCLIGSVTHPKSVFYFWSSAITLFRSESDVRPSGKPLLVFFCRAQFSSKSFQLLFYFGIHHDDAIHGWLIYIRSFGGTLAIPLIVAADAYRYLPAMCEEVPAFVGGGS